MEPSPTTIADATDRLDRWVCAASDRIELTAVGGHMVKQRLGSSVRRVVGSVHPLAHVSRSLVLDPEIDGVVNGKWIRPLRGLVAVLILDPVDVDAEQALPSADALVDLIPHPLARDGVGTDQDGSHRTLGEGSVDELLDRIVTFRLRLFPHRGVDELDVFLVERATVVDVRGSPHVLV